MNKNEKLEIENILKIIRRAKFEDFTGLEALALARAYHWLQMKMNEPEKTEVVPEIVNPIEEQEKVENGRKSNRFKRNKRQR